MKYSLALMLAAGLMVGCSESDELTQAPEQSAEVVATVAVETPAGEAAEAVSEAPVTDTPVSEAPDSDAAMTEAVAAGTVEG